MKKLSARSLSLVALSATLGFSSLVWAAPDKPAKPHDGHKRGLMGKKIAVELGLTDAQKSKLKPIIEAARNSRKAIREDDKLSPDQKRAKLKALRKQTDEQINAILTPEQRQKFEAMKKERRQNAGKHGGQKHGPDSAA